MVLGVREEDVPSSQGEHARVENNSHNTIHLNQRLSNSNSIQPASMAFPHDSTTPLICVSSLETQSYSPFASPKKDKLRRNSSIYTYGLNQYTFNPNKFSEPSSRPSCGELSININANKQMASTSWGAGERTFDTEFENKHPQPSFTTTVDRQGQYSLPINDRCAIKRELALPKKDCRSNSTPEYQCSTLNSKKEPEHHSYNSMSWVQDTGFNKSSLETGKEEMQSSPYQHSAIGNNQNNFIISHKEETCQSLCPSSGHAMDHHAHQYMSKTQHERPIIIPLTTTSSCTTTTTSNPTSTTPSQLSSLTNHVSSHMHHSQSSTTGSTSSSCNNSNSGGEEGIVYNITENVQNPLTPKTSGKMSTTNSKIPRKKYRRSLCIEERDLLRVLHLPQTQACSSLGCSLSTLKRRFYELKDKIGIDKWPQFYSDIRHLDAFPHIYPMSFDFVMNEEPLHEKYISSASMNVLSKAFERSVVPKPSQKGYSKLVFAEEKGICKRKKK